VVGVSSDNLSAPEVDEHLEICNYCGDYIDEPDKQCPALADGRCEP